MDFEIGSLDCKSLDLAEDAKKLQFQLSTSEVCTKMSVLTVRDHTTDAPARCRGSGRVVERAQSVYTRARGGGVRS